MYLKEQIMTKSKDSKNKTFKLGIVGCGAVVEKFHLPAIGRIKNIKISAVVDKDIKRAKKISSSLGNVFISSNYHDILSKVDIALIALPHFLHAPVSIAFMKQEVHVFCEKPMAVNPKEAKEMIRVATENNVKLSIGMMRRQFAIVKKTKELIESGYLGKIKSFDYEEGFPYDWPIYSKFIFDKKQAGGGVLMDMGAHVVDLLVYLFGKFGEIKVIDYLDDNYGGVEANCRINIKIGNIKGRVDLSNDRKLRNTFIIKFTNGYLELPSGGLTDLVISKSRVKEIFKSDETFADAFYKQMSNFTKAIFDDSSIFVSGKDALPSVEMINSCYIGKKQIYESWYSV